MNKIIALLLFTLALPVSAAPRHADGDYVVILNGNESPQRVKQAHRVGARPGRDHQWTANNGFHGFSAHLNGQQADNLEADTRVAVIEPNAAAYALASTLDFNGTLPFVGQSRGVALSGSVAYIASITFGLTLVDVSNPSAPFIIASVDKPFDGQHVAVVGTTAYVTGARTYYDLSGARVTSQGFYVIDCSVPANPRLVTKLESTSPFNGLAVAGRYAYVARGGLGLQVLDVSGAVPLPVGTVDTAGNALGVALSGTTAYVADSFGGLVSVNVANPASPGILNTIGTLGNANAVAVSGSTAYVAASRSMHIVNIATPSAMTMLGTFTMPSLSTALDVAVSGTTVYVGGGSGGLVTVNVAVPASPAQLAQFPFGTFAVLGVAVSGSMVYLANDTGGFVAVNVTNPAAPATLGSVAGEWFLGNYVAVSGGLAVVTGQTISNGGQASVVGMKVVSLANPNRPVAVGRIDNPGFTMNGVAISGTKAYVAGGGAGLKVIDISTPSSPTIIGTCNTAANATGVAVSGNTAYIADAFGGLVVIDITTPASPVILGTAATLANANAVAISGTTAYVAASRYLQTFNVAVPTAPTPLGTLALPANVTALDVKVAGTVAYIAGSGGGLVTVNVSVPTAPTLLGQLAFSPGASKGIWVAGSLAYVGNYDGGVSVVSVAAPASPTPLAKLLTPGTVGQVVFDGSHVISADGKGAVAVLTYAASAQLVPTGVQRIGTLSNAVANIGGHANVNADIAIIDTGIMLTHTDLNVYTNVTFVTGTTTGNDDNGHGTHVAGIAAAIDNNIGVVGVAPGARLWAVKVLDSSGIGDLATIISGVDYVAQHASEIEVANMSLGGQGPSDSLRLAVQTAVGRGVVFVVAAGNQSFDIYGGDKVLGTGDDFYPACYPEVMTVSAIADTDGLQGGLGVASSAGADDTMATFSNYSLAVVADNPVLSPGLGIDVAAPGVNIYSTWNNGGYSTLSGTSMASPHVAGAVALYIVAHTKPTTAAGVYAVRQALIDTAEPQSRWGINPVNPWPLFDFYPEGLVNVGPHPTNASPPSLTISSPVNGAAINATNAVNFVGAASDIIDGDLGPLITWSDSSLGRFGTGTNFLQSFSTSPGTHLVTARVSNSAGSVTNKTVQFSITNSVIPAAPILTITCPTNGASIATNPPPFTASASDAVDGDISADIRWYSQGLLVGAGGSVTNTFAIGSYFYRVEVCNSSDLCATNAFTFNVTNNVANTPPTIYIQQPLNGQTFIVGSNVTFSGTAADVESGNLSSSIVWTSAKDGLLGTGSTINKTNLTTGIHTNTASVTDPGGATSTARTIIQIINAPTNQLYLAQSLRFDGTSYKDHQKVAIKDQVTSPLESFNPVPNAIVTFTVRSPNGTTDNNSVSTGTTGFAGWGYRINKNKGGAGTWVVTAVATKTGYISATSTNSFTVP